MALPALAKLFYLTLSFLLINCSLIICLGETAKMQNTSKVCKNKFVSIVLIVFFVFGLFCFNTFETAKAYTGTITYDSGTNTITCVGGSSGTPIGFNDIYEADLADTSWNVTERLGSNQYVFNAKIIIGDSSTDTFFVDKQKSVYFSNSSTTEHYQKVIYVTDNAVFQLGQLDDLNLKRVSNGCTVIKDDLYWTRIIEGVGDVFLYDSVIKNINTGYFNRGYGVTGSNLRIWLCTISNAKIVSSGGSINIYRTNIINSAGSAIGGNPWLGWGDIIVDDILADNCEMLISQESTDNITISNAKTKNTNAVFCNHGSGGYVFLVNCDIDWLFSFRSDSTTKIFRQYTFNLNVLNGNITDFVDNATVQLWKDSNLIYEGYTNSSGMIPTQTLTYGFYQQSTGNTIQNASSPYYLVITHPDWQTYISRFYITEPLRLTVSMQEPDSNLDDLALGLIAVVVTFAVMFIYVWKRR